MTDAPTWLSALGAFAPAIAICISVILYLRHELTTAQSRIAHLSDERLEFAQQAIPILHEATEAIVATTRAMERQAEQLGQSNSMLLATQQTLHHVSEVLAHIEAQS